MGYPEVGKKFITMKVEVIFFWTKGTHHHYKCFGSFQGMSVSLFMFICSAFPNLPSDGDPEKNFR